MQITEIKIFPVEEEKLKAFVSVVFDGCFMVNDIKVIRGKDGLFISMPSRRKRNGRFKDVAHPLNNETRTMIEDRILADYERKKNGEEPIEETGDGMRSIGGAEESQTSIAKAGANADADDERTLEEVAEEHLSDSFWTA